MGLLTYNFFAGHRLSPEEERDAVTPERKVRKCHAGCGKRIKEDEYLCKVCEEAANDDTPF